MSKRQTKPKAGKSKPKQPRKQGAKAAPRKQGAAPLAHRKPKTESKLDTVVQMLRRPEGATIDQLMKATEWQSHSVRGVMSGSLKKRMQLEITSAKADGIRVYKIAAAKAA